MKFLSEISDLGRSTQVVSARSWHAKMYAYWRQHGIYKTDNYRENLCHYVRVVLIWTPLAWMRDARLIKGKISPILALIVLTYLVGATLLVATSGNALELAVLTFGLPGFYFLCIGVEKLFPGKMLNGFMRVGAVIAPPVSWFFNARLIAWVRPHMVVFALVIGLLSGDYPKFMIILAGVIAFWSIMIAAAYAAHRHDKRKKEKRDLVRKTAALESELRSMKFAAELESLSQRMINRIITREEYAKLMDELMKQMYPAEVVTEAPSKKIRTERTNMLAETFRLGIRFAAAKKHKICPFIVFEDDESLQLSA